MNWTDVFVLGQGQSPQGVTAEELYQLFRARMMSELYAADSGKILQMRPADPATVAAERQAQEQRQREVCPICHRSFQHVARHIQTEHPESAQ